MFTLIPLISIGLLHLSSAVRALQQVPVNWEGWKANKQPWADSPPVVLTPLQDFNLLSSEQFTTLGHPAFPNYNVRIKKSTDFCDGGVKYVASLEFLEPQLTGI